MEDPALYRRRPRLHRSNGEVITISGSIDSPVCEHLFIEWEKDRFKMLRSLYSEGLSGIKLARNVSDVFLFSRTGPVTFENINDVLQAVSKLASDYVPGWITKAQAEWRKKLLEPKVEAEIVALSEHITPFRPEDFIEKDEDAEWPHYSTLDGEISFDGKDEIIKRQNSEILFLRSTVSKLISQSYS